MAYIFRKAEIHDSKTIWNILQKAILRRKEDNSPQWQNGYPNPEVVLDDIERGIGYVLSQNGFLIGYCAIWINDEPAYDLLEGQWLTNGDYGVFHRVAVSEDYLGQGMAQMMLNKIEEWALKHKVYSLRADTHEDNVAMRRIFDKLGYTYCGVVYFNGSPRNAFEKVLKTST